jgi:hypothetical protein
MGQDERALDLQLSHCIVAPVVRCRLPSVTSIYSTKRPGLTLGFRILHVKRSPSLAFIPLGEHANCITSTVASLHALLCDAPA